MLRPLLFILFSLSILLPACEFSCNIGESGTGDKTKPVEKDGMALYNGIELETQGVKVKKAYLVTNDDRAERIGEGNFVDIKTGVKLVLLIKEGWKEINDRVWLGAALKVTADTGETILEKEDLFDTINEEGLSAEDAKALGLSVYLTKLNTRRPVSFDVSFKVWDKKGDAYIEGGYTIHTK